jgi:succinate dehydrogenase / fumarate reductase flavoprotein subunit
MATDIIVDDGRCLGIVGVHLPTGRYKIYRSTATILATGAPCWFYGWTGVSAQSINCADNTGDLDMATYRRGLGIGHCEFAAYDFTTTYPKGLGYGWGTCIDCDGQEPFVFGDKDGNPLFTDPNTVATLSLNRAVFNRELARMILEDGIADEHDQLTAVLKGHEIRRSFEVNIPLFEKFGIDPYEENLPTHCEMFERSSTAVVDDKLMTEIRGLFHARGAGSTDPTSSLTSSGQNALLGPYAAICAVEYMKNVEEADSVDLSTTIAEFERLEEILNRNPANGLRPFEVRHAIQETCAKSMGSIRRKADLEATVAELERIRKEDLPRMYVSSQSKTFNTEWKEAIENYNLLDEAELLAKASILREESRGQYLYVE